MSALCDQTTVRNEPCSRRATWVAADRRTGDDENYCTQHANYYGIPKRPSARKVPVGMVRGHGETL